MLQLFISSVIGFDLQNGKNSPVRVARIEGKNIIEGGLHWVRLAALLNLTHLPVRVVEYDYTSLKKRMCVTVQRDGALVGITSREKGTCDYYGIFPAQLDVLVRCHKVPCAEPTVTSTRKKTAVMEREDHGVRPGRKNHRKLVLVKN